MQTEHSHYLIHVNTYSYFVGVKAMWKIAQSGDKLLYDKLIWCVPLTALSALYSWIHLLGLSLLSKAWTASDICHPNSKPARQ